MKIEIESLIKKYGSSGREFEVLKGIDLQISDGEFVAVIGASGSGKSTLLNVISGLERADGGRVSYDGRDICLLSDKELTQFRRENIGFIFQQYYLLPNLTVDNNVKMGANLAGNKDYKQIIQAVGLADMLNKYPGALSGGEQQRVSIARALAKSPKVLYLDEPTGALDEATGRQVLDYICKLHAQLGFTMVMVTHNLNVADMADKVVVMNSGRISDTYKNEFPKTAYEIGW